MRHFEQMQDSLRRFYSHSNQLVADFKEKCELFSSFFAKQYCLIETGSTLPTQFTFKTNKTLNDINFTESDILRVISKLYHNKAHGHDEFSIVNHYI